MKFRSKWITKLAARAMVSVLRLLFLTCRKQCVIYPGTNSYDPELAERFLYCVWHDEMVFPLLMGRHWHVSALTSRHQDGSYLAETMKLLNIEPFRGSTTRGGAQAVRQLLTVAEQSHIVITPDGPRGPRRKMKEGIVFLASRTGQAIVPTAFSCQRGIRIPGTWTDLLLPLPFTTLHMISGQPIRLPPDLDREQIDFHMQRVQDVMDNLSDRLAGWIAGRFTRAEIEQAAEVPQRKAA